MKNDNSIKTSIITVVTLLHLLGIYLMWQQKKEPEPVSVDNLTFVDLGSLDGNNVAAADGAPALAESAPPPAPTPPPPPKPPKPEPKPEKKPEPKPEPKPDTPQVKAVVKENKPADFIQPKEEKPEKPKPKPEPEKPKEKEKPKEPEKPKDPPKEIPKEQPKETPKEQPKESPKEAPKESPKSSPSSSESSQANPNSNKPSSGTQAGAQAGENKGKGGANTSENGRADGGGGTNPNSSTPGNGRGSADGKGDGKGAKGDGDRQSAATGILDGGYIEKPAPPYPQAALEREEQGSVKLSVVVSPSGSVESVTKIKSSGSSALDRAAEKAARSARYAPKKTSDGTPLRTRFTVGYTFSLGE